MTVTPVFNNEIERNELFSDIYRMEKSWAEDRANHELFQGYREGVKKHKASGDLLQLARELELIGGYHRAMGAYRIFSGYPRALPELNKSYKFSSLSSKLYMLRGKQNQLSGNELIGDANQLGHFILLGVFLGDEKAEVIKALKHLALIEKSASFSSNAVDMLYLRFVQWLAGNYIETVFNDIELHGPYKAIADAWNQPSQFQEALFHLLDYRMVHQKKPQISKQIHNDAYPGTAFSSAYEQPGVMLLPLEVLVALKLNPNVSRLGISHPLLPTEVFSLLNVFQINPSWTFDPLLVEVDEMYGALVGESS